MALLVVMLALKLLETRVLRDAMLLIFLGYFLVITNFLYSQTIPTALYMLACIWVITTTMIGLHYARREPPLAARFRTAGILLAQSTPLMLVLFLLFPRVTGPLWGLPQDAHAGATGLSDTMTPGSLSNLILSDAVAFRVKFVGNHAAAQAALLARPGHVGFRRPHLDGAARALRHARVHRARPPGRVRGHAGAAQQALALRARPSRQGAAARVRERRLPAATRSSR